MTSREATPLDSFGTELSLAVGLTDRYTDCAPRGEVAVRLANAADEFLATPSGYHVLVDVPAEPADFEVVVESEYYLDERRSVPRSSLDPAEPLESFSLVPAPAYPFGGGATMVRGTVTDGGDPVADAPVAYVQGSDRTRTNADGEFALPVEDVSRDDVVREGDGTNGGGPGGGGPGSGGASGGDADAGSTDDGGQRTLQPGGDPPSVEATHPGDGRTTEAEVAIPIGGTSSVDLSF